MKQTWWNSGFYKCFHVAKELSSNRQGHPVVKKIFFLPPFSPCSLKVHYCQSQCVLLSWCSHLSCEQGAKGPIGTIGTVRFCLLTDYLLIYLFTQIPCLLRAVMLQWTECTNQLMLCAERCCNENWLHLTKRAGYILRDNPNLLRQLVYQVVQLRYSKDVESHPPHFT